jgi:hypothetical protein
MSTYNKDTISEEKYRLMLNYEEQLRKSDFIQRMYQSKDTDETIIKLVQQTVLTKFGFRNNDADVEQYLDTLDRFDRSTFPQYWIKNNIHAYPDFTTGQFFPKCKVYDQLCQPLNFPDDFKYHLGGKPLVVIASSDS